MSKLNPLFASGASMAWCSPCLVVCGIRCSAMLRGKTCPDQSVSVALAATSAGHSRTVRYRTAENVVLDPKDAQLLLDDGGDSNKAAQRLANMQKSVPWLVRPDYISSETKAYGRAKTVADHTVLAGQQEHARDRDSQIAAIEATFEAAQAPPKHPTKRGVHAVEEYPIFPDFKLWKNLYYEALFGGFVGRQHPQSRLTAGSPPYPFPSSASHAPRPSACPFPVADSDPSPTTLMVDKDEVREQLSQGLLIGRQTATGDVVAHYFLPDAETTRKRKARRDGGDDVQEGEEHQYRQVREYSWQIEEKTKGAEVRQRRDPDHDTPSLPLLCNDERCRARLQDLSPFPLRFSKQDHIALSPVPVTP